LSDHQKSFIALTPGQFLSPAHSNCGHSSDVDVKMQIPYLKSAIKAVRVSQLTKREKASYLPLSDFYNDA